MKDEKESSIFRAWLIEKVSSARWAQYHGDTDEAVAKRLGIQVEVLVAARALFEEKQIYRPKKTRLGMPKIAYQVRPMVDLEPPEEIYREWVAVRDGRNLTDTLLVRSALHHVLRLKWQPWWLAEKRKRFAWFWRGQWYGQRNIRLRRFRIRALVKESMVVAIQERAARTGVTPSAIVRWAFLSVCEGKIRNLLIVPNTEILIGKYEYCLDPKILMEEPR